MDFCFLRNCNVEIAKISIHKNMGYDETAKHNRNNF
ncbi:unknown [Tannerella sp. CAG:118]|uniref:Uncharacterized protein n=1 Tax=Coprobacter secundus subsp. similis TaxID=2751153 RepID=A0A7G1HV51_9BACT|nr:hypothetical protein Cop2CBH44_10050 [Coprobacter secundus subsp. similis]CCY37901.1 unknown [Tannerella sp. CAG:118]